MWQINIIKMIRAIIGDASCETSPYQYSDIRLLNLATISAYTVYNTISFDNEYTINIGSNLIDPDPFAINDSAFNILTAYKAASTLLNSEVKAQAANSVSVKDGPSSISMAGMGRELQAAAKIALDTYKDLEYDYKRTKSSENFFGIISPYYTETFLVANYDKVEADGDLRWQ